MKFNVILKSLIAIAAIASAAPLRAQESEPGNDVYTGADSVNTPLARNLQMANGDEDWILVNKSKCEQVTVRVTNGGSPGFDAIRIRLYTRTVGLPPSATTVDDKTVIGGGSTSLSYSLTGVTAFYVQVTPTDIMGTIDYTVATTSTNANAPILVELTQNKNRLKRLEKKLKKVDKSKKKKIKKSKKKIKDQKAKIKNIEGLLCPE